MSEVLTLILAWKMALAYKENESKAIYVCANNIWKNVKDENTKLLIMQLAQRKTSDSIRIKAVKELEQRLRKEKML